MWRRSAVLSTFLPLLGLTLMADAVYAADSPETERLQERIRVLEERLDRLDRVDVIKKTVEYVCPGGEIFDQAPPGGRCPDGSRPLLRDTFRKSTVGAARVHRREDRSGSSRTQMPRKSLCTGPHAAPSSKSPMLRRDKTSSSVRGRSISRCCTIHGADDAVHRF